jgi:hypothetical protein
MATPSKAQINANRRNAKRSTGPKSIQGKLKVSQNAITHGIFAASPLLPNENAEEFKELCQGIATVYPAVDELAAGLVERIVLCLWRQKRLRVAEAAKLQISMTPEIMVEEINDLLRLPYTRRLNAEAISEEMEETFNYWEKVLNQFNGINIKAVPSNLDKLQATCPEIYYQLKQAASRSDISDEAFMKNPEKIIASLEKTKKYAEDFVSTQKSNHTAYQIAQQMKLAKLIPGGSNLEFLSKYQVQLDTDLYRAIDAYRKHGEWRAKTLEVEVSEEEAN